MSRKFVYQLGVLLGSSGKSKRSHTGRAPRRSAAQKRAEEALFERQFIERSKAQVEMLAYKELLKAINKDKGLMAASKEEAVKRGHKIYRERGNPFFNMVHNFFFSVETNIRQENEMLGKAIDIDDSLKDICIKDAVKRGHKIY